MIQIVVRNQSIWCVKSPDEHITTGLTGKTVSFDFGPDWDGYVKTAIFEGSGESIPRLLTGDRTTIPAGCLTEAGGILRVGVYGTDGKVQTPTVYTVIDQIEDWQKRLAADGVDPVSPHFVHASDEWYILAGRELPEEERYDGYLQLENGVGMVRLLENEVRAALESPSFLKEAD